MQLEKCNSFMCFLRLSRFSLFSDISPTISPISGPISRLPQSHAVSMQQYSNSITLSALRLVISLDWVPIVTSLQLTCLQVLIECRCSREFRLRVARKTPRRVWYAKLGGKCRGRRPPERSARLSVPKVTRMIYDRRSFVELDEGWTLPKELLGLVLGTEFDGEIEGVVWPSALESVVFWRRCPRVFFETCSPADSFRC